MATNLTPPDGLDVGDGRTLVATFTTSAGQAATVDPGDVVLTIKAPDGTLTQYTGAQLSEAGGVVSIEHTFDMAGTWLWRFEWDNGVDSPQAEEGRVFVRRREVPGMASTR